MSIISARSSKLTFTITLLLLILSGSFLFAQAQSADGARALWVTGAATAKQVRYVAPLSVYQLRVEVYDLAGNKLFDSGPRLGNLFDWAWQDQRGERLADGLYRCLVTVKDFSGQTGQRTATLRRQGDEATLQADERGDWSSEGAATLLGHDGQDARLSSSRGDLSFRLGDFAADREVERMRLTKEGNLGIGIERPQARLDVAGLIRTSEGIVFPDGSVQTTAARGASKGGKMGRTIGERAAGAGGVQLLTVAAPEQEGVFNNITMNATDFGGGLRIADIRLSNINAGLRFTATPGLGASPDGAAIQFWGNTSAFPGNLFLDSGALNSANLIFRTAITGGTITERMRVTAAGNVGIGTNSPAAPLDVRDQIGTGARIQVGALNATVADRIITFGDAGCGGPCVYIGEQTADDRLVLSASEFRFRIGSVLPESNGNQNLGSPTNRWAAVFAVNGTIQTSDARLKRGVTNLRYGLRDLMQLRPVTFQWKDRSDGRNYLGLIAQEVAAVIPEAVERSADAATPLGINYSNLIPVLIKATQEQQTALEQKEAEVKALKAENAVLNARLTTLEQMMRQLQEQLKPAATAPAKAEQK